MKKALIVLLVGIVAVGFVFAGGAKEDAAGAKAAQKPEVITVGLTSWPNTLDPVVGIGKRTSRINTQIFDTVLYIDNDGSLKSYICDDWYWIDDYTSEFKLKDGITFHNGLPLTAEDVKYSFERVLLDTTGYSDPNALAVIGTIKEITIIDAKTFRITTKDIDPILFSRLGSNLGLYVVNKAYLEEVGTDVFSTKPIGSGPYKVDNITPERLELSYYEGYYGEVPLAKKLVYRYFAEEAALITALVTGELDLARDVTSTAATVLKGYSNLKIDSQKASASHLLRFNAKTGATADKKLRQALSLAIDRELLVETLWDGYASIPNGYNYPEFDDFYVEDYPEYEYNVAKAKQLVAESSYDGTVLSYQLIPGYYPMGVEAAEAIVDMWKQIGVNARVEYKDAVKTNAIVNLANWSNGLRFSDPLGGIGALWSAGSGPQKDLWNAPERFNELGLLIQTETDVAKRKAYYKEQLQIWDDEVPGTILYCPDDITVVRKGLSLNYTSGKPLNLRAGYLGLE